MPWKVFKDGEKFCVHKLNADDSKGESVKCFDSEAAANDQLKALYANVKEFSGEFTDIMAITELRGSYPNVPISADIDYAALIAGETGDPVFITLPIAKVNAKSGNGRYYDEAFVTELMRQTLSQRPVGLMGHMTEAERATAFKPEAVHWVGAIRDGDLIWGKGLVVGEAKARIGRYKASGKSIATSIDAYATGVWDESLHAYRMDAASLRLNQIDLAPADRAGIPDLARVPVLTTEMQSEVVEVEQEASMPEKTKLEIITELTADDARILPEPVRAAVLQSATPAPEVAQVQELRTALGVDDKADLPALITEMKQAREEARKAAISSRITELVTGGVKLESARGIVSELVAARNPQTPEEAQVAYTAVMEMASVKETLEATLQRAMGPAQRTNVAAQRGANKYFQIPKEA